MYVNKSGDVIRWLGRYNDIITSCYRKYCSNESLKLSLSFIHILFPSQSHTLSRTHTNTHSQPRHSIYKTVTSSTWNDYLLFQRLLELRPRYLRLRLRIQSLKYWKLGSLLWMTFLDTFDCTRLASVLLTTPLQRHISRMNFFPVLWSFDLPCTPERLRHLFIMLMIRNSIFL